MHVNRWRARALAHLKKKKKKITLADFLIKESPSHQRYCNESLTHTSNSWEGQSHICFFVLFFYYYCFFLQLLLERTVCLYTTTQYIVALDVNDYSQ